MAQPEGYIRENMIRFKRWVPLVTAAAEDADVIQATISLGVFEKRELVAALAAGENPGTVFVPYSEFPEDAGMEYQLIVELIDLATGLRPETTAFTITATAGGRGSINGGEGTALVIASCESGYVDLDITDVAGGSGLTLAVRATMVFEGSGYAQTIEFDGV